MFRGHTRTGHNQILRCEVRKGIAAKSERASNFAQLAHGFAQLHRLTIIHRGNVRATRRAETRRRDARSRQPHDQHAFAFEFDSWTHHYLNFNVVSENSAKTSATIQKRTMIFDSLHP